MDDLVSRRGTTAEEILFVLNGCRTVPLESIQFAVVTGVYTPHRLEPADWPFTPGEILPVVMDHDGSPEFLGQGRDPYAGWEDASFCIHLVEDLAAAREVADLVLSDRPRGYYTWIGDGLTYDPDQDAAHSRWAGDDGWLRIGDFAGRGQYAEWKAGQG